MKVCDVVVNSVWYDPRVRKQIISYLDNGVDIYCVGFKCNRYDNQKVSEMPCRTYIAEIDEKYVGKLKNVFRKLKREKLTNKSIEREILREKPDIIHANDLNALIPAYAAAKKLKCKLIYDSHEVYTENNMFVGRKLYKWFFEKKEKKLIKKVDLMVCVSNAAAEYFKEKYKIEKPIVVTNCSLKSESVLNNTQKNECFEVLNHGQFYAGRGYELMVGACALLKDYPEIKLAIRGFGVLEEQMRQEVRDNEYTNFEFYPPVAVQELVPYASKSMVGVAITLPICLNFKLSISNKLFEYVSAGLPVIMSDIPEHRYLNNKYNFGIVLEENTSKCFAEAVKKLYLDKDFYSECVKNTVKMSEEINWENEFDKLLKKEEGMFNGKK